MVVNRYEYKLLLNLKAKLRSLGIMRSIALVSFNDLVPTVERKSGENSFQETERALRVLFGVRADAHRNS